MVSKLLLAIALFGLVAADTCRKFECGELDSDLCMKVTDNKVTVNEDGGKCKCFITPYRTALQAYSSINDTEYATDCDDDEDDDEDEDDKDESSSSSSKSYPPTACAKDNNKRLATGSHPKACSTSGDCELQDGTFATCQCSVDGNYYCKADLGDPDMFSTLLDLWCKDGYISNIDSGTLDQIQEMSLDDGKISCYDKSFDKAFLKGVNGDSDAVDNYEDQYKDDFGYILVFMGILAYVF